MKYRFLIACLWLFSCNQKTASNPDAQQIIVKDPSLIKNESANPYTPVDVSPMDMAYFPADYAVKKMNDTTAKPPLARVIYSRPHRGGRTIFGGLVTWGQPWRLGANEATEIEFFQPVTIQKKRIEKGQYILYAIPFEDHWVIVLNRNLYSWGLKFNAADDVARFQVPAITKAQTIEYFTITFDKTDAGADLLMAWEAMEVRLPIQF